MLRCVVLPQPGLGRHAVADRDDGQQRCAQVRPTPSTLPRGLATRAESRVAIRFSRPLAVGCFGRPASWLQVVLPVICPLAASGSWKE